MSADEKKPESAPAAAKPAAKPAAAPAAPKPDVSKEEALADEIRRKLEDGIGAIRVQRPRRLWADVPPERFKECVETLGREFGFTYLATITGRDDGERLSALYHLARRDGTVLTLVLSVPRENPVIPTLTDRALQAELYERELADLFGFVVEGLKPGRNYPLPDNWPFPPYPLRKDWQQVPAGALKGKEDQHG